MPAGDAEGRRAEVDALLQEAFLADDCEPGAESPWSTRPWGSASAKRQECPARPHNRTSTTLSRSNWGISVVTKTMGSASASRQECPARPHNRDIHHLVKEQLGNLEGPTNSLDHWNRPLHRDVCANREAARPAQQGRRSPCPATGERKTMGNCLCATTGILTAFTPA